MYLKKIISPQLYDNIFGKIIGKIIGDIYVALIEHYCF